MIYSSGTAVAVTQRTLVSQFVDDPRAGSGTIYTNMHSSYFLFLNDISALLCKPRTLKGNKGKILFSLYQSRSTSSDMLSCSVIRLCHICVLSLNSKKETTQHILWMQIMKAVQSYSILCGRRGKTLLNCFSSKCSYLLKCHFPRHHAISPK